MGKYMRKAKTIGDTVVVEMSPSSLGVRTRAKTLALQRLQSVASSTAPPPPQNPSSCYLELRSRRLVKQPPQQQSSRRGRRSCGCRGREPSADGTREDCCESSLISCSIEADDLEIEASFGENNIGVEARERSTRDCAPCGSTRAMGTTGSSTKQINSRTPSQRVPLNAVFVNIPTPLELEDFFAYEEQLMQRHFTEKYNFDFVNESPLPGPYEWVAVSR